MAIPCSQGKAVGTEGAVKQQEMELVARSVSSSSSAPAQGRAATPWHCQREAPRAGHGRGADLSSYILPARREPNPCSPKPISSQLEKEPPPSSSLFPSILNVSGCPDSPGCSFPRPFHWG